MTQQDDITQRVLTDADIEALAKKHIAPHAGRLDTIMANPVPYQQTEQFRRVKALIVDVLSKLRAPVAEPRLEWSAKALYDAIKDVLLNHRLSNLVDEDGESFPLVDHLCRQDDQTTESGEFEIALICDAIYNDVLTKSAPVAGEAKHDTDSVCAWQVWWNQNKSRFTTTRQASFAAFAAGKDWHNAAPQARAALSAPQAEQGERDAK